MSSSFSLGEEISICGRKRGRLRPMCPYSETSDAHTEDSPRPFLLLREAKTGEP